ncbi:hypothetical protein Aperf_G00000049669 [Anoplocephala perfoliata]
MNATRKLENKIFINNHHLGLIFKNGKELEGFIHLDAEARLSNEVSALMSQGKNDEIWLYGIQMATVRFDWDCSQAKEGNQHTLMNIYMEFERFLLSRYLDDSFLSGFILIVNPTTIKTTVEFLPPASNLMDTSQQRTFKIRSLKFTRWEGFTLQPIEGVKWSWLQRFTFKTAQLLSSNFFVKHLIQSTMAHRIMKLVEKYSLQQIGNEMLVTTGICYD